MALHRESLNISREVQHGRGIADSLRELGRLHLEHGRARDEGCQLLAEAVRRYHEMGLLDIEQAARETIRQLGCED